MEFKVGFRKRKSDSGEVMSLLTKSIFAILLLVTCAATTADTAAHPADTVHVGPYATETEHQRNDRMAWWREARFGLFIHWGVYAVPAGIHEGERIVHPTPTRHPVPKKSVNGSAVRGIAKNYRLDFLLTCSGGSGLVYRLNSSGPVYRLNFETVSHPTHLQT